jgi:hypothetical protein
LQENPLPKGKKHVSKIETKCMDGQLKHVLDIDREHVLEAKKKHDTNHVLEVCHAKNILMRKQILFHI